MSWVLALHICLHILTYTLLHSHWAFSALLYSSFPFITLLHAQFVSLIKFFFFLLSSLIKNLTPFMLITVCHSCFKFHRIISLVNLTFILFYWGHNWDVYEFRMQVNGILRQKQWPNNVTWIRNTGHKHGQLRIATGTTIAITLKQTECSGLFIGCGVWREKMMNRWSEFWRDGVEPCSRKCSSRGCNKCSLQNWGT